MRESRSYGSVGGPAGNRRPYPEGRIHRANRDLLYRNAERSDRSDRSEACATRAPRLDFALRCRQPEVECIKFRNSKTV